MINMNETMLYPSITICRWPAYKADLFEKYGLTNPQITYSSVWQSFNFENYTLSEFFDETTYNLSEFAAAYALDGYRRNIAVTSVVTLTMGRCFTLSPRNHSTSWGSSSGYFLYTRHTGDGKDNSLYSSKDIGFYVYVHELNSVFTEKLNNGAYSTEDIFVDLGVGLQYKLTVTCMTKLSTQNQWCNNDRGYNSGKCKEICLNQLITKDIGCSTPWLPNKDLPECKTARQTQLAVDYSSPGSLFLEQYLSRCQCPKACSTTMFFPYFQGEKAVSYPYDSTLSLYYGTGIVTSLVERFGYDENAFLADIGGSLGFLLGLSVVGFVAWFEKLILTFAVYAKKMTSKKNNNGSETSNEPDCETSTSKIEDDNTKIKNNSEEKQIMPSWESKVILEKNENNFLNSKSFLSKYQNNLILPSPK
ncbi:uncharacterized protein LOC108734611 isoform X2 [Agrilus planipennis]|nr:uncharacterized protein LOC108734611 isoform X2 [Agrilus planipennis]